jgi:hypothetical protein
VNSYGNDGGMGREEKKKPFPSLPTPPWKARKQPRASHIPTACGDDLVSFFLQARLTSTWTKSVTYMPGTFCYRYARSHSSNYSAASEAAGYGSHSIKNRPRGRKNSLRKDLEAGRALSPSRTHIVCQRSAHLSSANPESAHEVGLISGLHRATALPGNST